MKEDGLKNEGNALISQKHQLREVDDKLSEIDVRLARLINEQNSNNDMLDQMLDDMEGLLESNPPEIFDTRIKINLYSIEQELESDLDIKDAKDIKEIDNIKFDENMPWDEYMKFIEYYGFRNNLNSQEDPFKKLMTKTQQIELQKRIKEDFTYKNANCDKYDYMIAGTCGIIGGLIDILFVGVPTDSKLGSIADEHARKITEQFASWLGWDKEKVIKNGKNTTASAIGFLEGKFKINYDQATTHATDGVVSNLTLKNHHLKSLAHSPDIIGLFFSILNQFNSTSTFISNGELITIDTKDFTLNGGNFIAKIFCGLANWFGHIMSDWAGSSGTVGQGGRGTGVPIPFYNLLLTMNIGEFGQHKQTFAQIATQVFEKGYDFRHSMAMAIPVIVTELFVRFMYTMKAHFYHKKDWKDSIPKGSIPELRRMLLVGHGTLCVVDGVDATIRSGTDMIQFLLRTNLIAWVRFGHIGLKEVNAWHKSGHINEELVNEYLEKEYKKTLKQ